MKYDPLFFTWLIGQTPEILTNDDGVQGVWDEGDNYIDANGNGVWDAGDPYTQKDITIYRQPGFYQIGLVVRDDYFYTDTVYRDILVLDEFNRRPNARLGNFPNDRLKYYLPYNQAVKNISFPLS